MSQLHNPLRCTSMSCLLRKQTVLEMFVFVPLTFPRVFLPLTFTINKIVNPEGKNKQKNHLLVSYGHHVHLWLTDVSSVRLVYFRTADGQSRYLWPHHLRLPTQAHAALGFCWEPHLPQGLALHCAYHQDTVTQWISDKLYYGLALCLARETAPVKTSLLLQIVEYIHCVWTVIKNKFTCLSSSYPPPKTHTGICISFCKLQRSLASLPFQLHQPLTTWSQNNS